MRGRERERGGGVGEKNLEERKGEQESRASECEVAADSNVFLQLQSSVDNDQCKLQGKERNPRRDDGNTYHK